jgi:hypothetical protein
MNSNARLLCVGNDKRESARLQLTQVCDREETQNVSKMSFIWLLSLCSNAGDLRSIPLDQVQA